MLRYRAVSFLAPIVALTVSVVQSATTYPATWTTPVEPFKILGNINYVGTADLASYLIVTAAGSILIETGVEPNVDLVARSVARLGVTITDVKTRNVPASPTTTSARSPC